jgi:hypothetical protein
MKTVFITMVALALSVVGAQAQGLKISNIRNTYGEIGGTRPDSKFLPGDVLYVGFDIENITINAEGGAKYAMAMEVTDKNNKSIFKQDPAEREDFAPLGGNKLPARAFITLGLDMEPGEYTMKVVVTDKGKANAQETITRKFEVLKKDFGIVSVYTSVDDAGRIPAPTTGIVGQSIFVQFGVVAFARDPKTKQPTVDIEIMPLDEAGKPTLQKPIAFTQKMGVIEDAEAFPLRVMVPLTRAGKFTVRLKATDKISNKSYTFDLPVAAVPSAN